jgi:nucleoside-diphosphate-sugar epimerase
MILVTGGAGYIGSQLVHELIAQGHDVRVVDRFWFGNPFLPHERLELIDGDVREVNRSWFDGVTAVIHLAGLSNDPTADFAPDLNSESNVLATRILAEATAETAFAEDREIRFLLASTCSVYYSPTSDSHVNVKLMTEDLPVAPTANYSKTKRLAELEVLRVAERAPKFCPVILRKGTIFGSAPRMRFDLVVNTFTLHAWRKGMVTVHGHGEAWRPLLHIRDAVDAYSHLLWSPTDRIRCEVFNLVHKNYRVLELAHWVAEVLQQHRGADIQVKRDRNVGNGTRSYYVSGDKITEALGFRAERGTSEAVLTIWDTLERGDYGPEPENDKRFFNIAWLKERLLQESAIIAKQEVSV